MPTTILGITTTKSEILLVIRQSFYCCHSAKLAKCILGSLTPAIRRRPFLSAVLSLDLAISSYWVLAQMPSIVTRLFRCLWRRRLKDAHHRLVGPSCLRIVDPHGVKEFYCKEELAACAIIRDWLSRPGFSGPF